MMRLSRVFRRYTAFQIPGWILAAVGGGGLHRTIGFSGWAAGGVFVAWLIKDFALYPFLRSAYKLDYTSRLEHLVGERGLAVQTLSPAGYVRVHGELWRATRDSSAAIVEGDTVEITGIQGRFLMAQRVELARSELDRCTSATHD